MRSPLEKEIFLARFWADLEGTVLEGRFSETVLGADIATILIGY